MTYPYILYVKKSAKFMVENLIPPDTNTTLLYDRTNLASETLEKTIATANITCCRQRWNQKV